jgi:D-beta-D-heptose 7-phosphate kinase/D-beta-D-heptose 1-phosphate adenosyltransferase
MSNISKENFLHFQCSNCKKWATVADIFETHKTLFCPFCGNGEKYVTDEMETQKISDQSDRVVVAVSGGFDPVHIGHVRMFTEAKQLGNKLVVILNNDHWLREKKGFVFMPQAEREEIIRSFRAVDDVMLTEHPENPSDMSVCAELRKLKPNIFANGGDRKLDNIPEASVCEEIGCELVFNIGHGGKLQSSSWLLAKYLDNQEISPLITKQG